MGAKNNPTPKEANLPRTSTSSARSYVRSALTTLVETKKHTNTQFHQTSRSFLKSDSPVVPEIWELVAVTHFNLIAISHTTCFENRHFLEPKSLFSRQNCILTDVGDYENRPRLVSLLTRQTTNRTGNSILLCLFLWCFMVVCRIQPWGKELLTELERRGEERERQAAASQLRRRSRS